VKRGEALSMRIRPIGVRSIGMRSIGIAGAGLALLGCNNAGKWLSEKADERIAHGIESATDQLTGEKNLPSGLPNPKRKASRARGPSVHPSVAPAPTEEPTMSSPAP